MPLIEKILSTFRQKHLCYSNYDKFLQSLKSDDFQVLPLSNIAEAAPDKIAIFIRHDIDYDLHGALRMAEIEYSYGLSCTYFILHTAKYFNHPGLLTYLHILQDRFNHEIGWHHNIHQICRKCNYVNPTKYITEKLNWLRDNGIKISGFSNHKGQVGFCLGNYKNYFDYDACRLDMSFLEKSDCVFKNAHRWSPADLDLGSKKKGDKIGILIHPIHWTKKSSISAIRHQLKYLYFAIKH